MKKLLLFLLGLITVLCFVPFLIKDYLIQNELGKLQEEKGLKIQYESSNLDVSYFHLLSLELMNVIVENSTVETEAKLVEIKELNLSLSILSLFQSNPEICSILIKGGRSHFVTDEKGYSNFIFKTKKSDSEHKEVIIKHFEVRDFDFRYSDFKKEIQLSGFVEDMQWEERDSVSVHLAFLLKEYIVNDEKIFSDRELQVNSTCRRLNSGFFIDNADFKIGSLQLRLNQVNKIEWKLSSNSSYIEDFFEILPDCTRPKKADYSSNRPLNFEVSIQRGKVKSAKVLANDITLRNIKSGEQIDEINFTYNYEKDNAELTDVVVSGIGMRLHGAVSTKKLKDNNITSSLTGEVNFEKIITFFYSGKYKGGGQVSFVSDVSKDDERLNSTIAIDNLFIQNNKGENLGYVNGKMMLTGETMLVDHLVLKNASHDLIIDGKVTNPINYLLLNEQPVTGDFSFTSEKLKVCSSQIENLNVEVEFGFVPSKKYLYIFGLPVDPLAKATFFKVKTVDFMQPAINKLPVHFELTYDTKEKVQLKKLMYQVGDTSLIVEVVADKPNPALFIFEEQELWLHSRSENFCLANLMQRIGIQSDNKTIVTGSFETILKYEPKQLLSEGRLSAVSFQDLVIDFTINGQQVFATGNASYQNKVLEASDLKASESQKELLEYFFSTVF